MDKDNSVVIGVGTGRSRYEGLEGLNGDGRNIIK